MFMENYDIVNIVFTQVVYARQYVIITKSNVVLNFQNQINMLCDSKSGKYLQNASLVLGQR